MIKTSSQNMAYFVCLSINCLHMLCMVLFFVCVGYAHLDRHEVSRNQTCPSEDPLTHECYGIIVGNTSCILPSNVTTNTETGVTVSYTLQECPVYRCQYRGCCEGWVRNTNGTCVRADSFISELCQNGGMFNATSSSCMCRPGYTGEMCETSTCDGWCSNGGWCDIVDGIPSCICPSKYLIGILCEQVVCEKPCMNGGNCVKDGVLGVCHCPQGFQGDQCQFNANPKCPVFTKASWGKHYLQYGHGIGFIYNRQCFSDADCENALLGETLCCYNGTSGVCTKPTPMTCTWEGQEYTAGFSFRPSPCQTCLCQVGGDVHCTFTQCPETLCPGGGPAIQVNDHCCKICPGDDLRSPSSPTFASCPDLVPVPVSETGSVAILPDLNLIATNWDGEKLYVWYSDHNFTHSHSSEVQTNIHFVMAYSDWDQYGRRAECVFRVIVTDRTAPAFQSCPAQIYALVNEKIAWKQPVASDNVGIFRVEANGDEVYGKHLTTGTYPVTYTVWDYDQNQAICAFIIKVFNAEYGEVQMRDTSRDQIRSPLFVVAACSGGVLVIIVVTCIVTILLRWWSHIRRLPRPPAYQRHEENIYAICGPPNRGRGYENVLSLPAYAPPTNPPSYDELNHELWTYVNTNNVSTYDELNHKNEQPKYVNQVEARGELNTSFIHDEHRLEYMKI